MNAQQLTCIHPITGKETEAFRCNRCEEIKPEFMRSRSSGIYCKKCKTQMHASTPCMVEKRKKARDIYKWKSR